MKGLFFEVIMANNIETILVKRIYEGIYKIERQAKVKCNL